MSSDQVSMPKKPRTYYGADAVRKVSQREGRPMTMGERRVIEEEAYVDGEYKDDKGITTAYVGQTGEWMGKSFDETYRAHRQRASEAVPKLEELPEYLAAEITQLAYRGDTHLKNGNPAGWTKLLNAGRVAEAAQELLNHNEYKERKAKGDDGVTRRLEAAQAALFEYAQEQQ